MHNLIAVLLHAHKIQLSQLNQTYSTQNIIHHYTFTKAIAGSYVQLNIKYGKLLCTVRSYIIYME